MGHPYRGLDHDSRLARAHPVLAAFLERPLPRGRRARAVHPGSIEIEATGRDGRTFACTVVYPLETVRALLKLDDDELAALLRERCGDCDYGSRCGAG